MIQGLPFERVSLDPAFAAAAALRAFEQGRLGFQQVKNRDYYSRCAYFLEDGCVCAIGAAFEEMGYTKEGLGERSNTAGIGTLVGCGKMRKPDNTEDYEALRVLQRKHDNLVVTLRGAGGYDPNHKWVKDFVAFCKKTAGI